MVIRFRTKANAKGVLCRPFTERRWLRDFNTRDHGGTNLSSGPDSAATTNRSNAETNRTKRI